MDTPYEIKKAALLKQLARNTHQTFILKKNTASNLFRYIHRSNSNKKAFTVKNFDNIIAIDTHNQILDVEGLTSYEKIVQFTLQHGLLPTVAPELKHITVGGAIVGIGIESTCFKYGFVHDGLLAAEVLLPNGTIVTCTPNNEHADLFHALPNSYGTLGYILRARIKLYPVLPFIQITIQSFTDASLFIDAMEAQVLKNQTQFIEGLVFGEHELYLMTGDFINNAKQCADIYHSIFYKLIQQQKTVILKTEDYIFRYDPDWFWNIPETPWYHFLRRFAPKAIRNSGLYKKYIDFKKRYLGFLSSSDDKEETLIQDWEVPWENAHALLLFALKNISLFGKPWAVVPIIPQSSPTLYPVKNHRLYFNLGCYSASERQSEVNPFHNTQLMDAYCFNLKGIKMLYSSTFLSQASFSEIYNGLQYQQLKHRYDPQQVLGNLYNKVAL